MGRMSNVMGNFPMNAPDYHDGKEKMYVKLDLNRETLHVTIL